MKYEEFREEVGFIERRFEKEISESKTSDLFASLQGVSIWNFRKACRWIRDNLEYMPKNLVFHVNKFLDSNAEHRATGGNEIKEECSACCGGWVTVKVDYGSGTAVKRCLCSQGQRISDKPYEKDGKWYRILTATEDECQKAARKEVPF